MKTKRLLERRNGEFEVRAEGGADGSPTEIVAYPIVFNQETVIGGVFREVIRPEAVTKTLQEANVVALWDHDPGKPLGRVSAGTLELRADEHGVRSVIRPSIKTSFGQDALESVRLGNVNGGSFGFQVIRERVTRGEEGELDLREVLELRLFEVSLVTFPAYAGTEAEARARADAEAVVRSWGGDERGDNGGLATSAPDQESTREPDQRWAELKRLELEQLEQEMER